MGARSIAAPPPGSSLACPRESKAFQDLSPSVRSEPQLGEFNFGPKLDIGEDLAESRVGELLLALAHHGQQILQPFLRNMADQKAQAQFLQPVEKVIAAPGRTLALAIGIDFLKGEKG